MGKTSEVGWSEIRIKNLEHLETAIARMSNQSAALKNYCITITSAIIGLAVVTNSLNILLLSTPLILVFSLLDASYLKLERGFAQSFATVKNQTESKHYDFIVAPDIRCISIFSTFASWSVFPFYAAIVVTQIGIFFILK